jgi:hypothetical protein
MKITLTEAQKPNSLDPGTAAGPAQAGKPGGCKVPPPCLPSEQKVAAFALHFAHKTHPRERANQFAHFQSEQRAGQLRDR